MHSILEFCDSCDAKLSDAEKAMERRFGQALCDHCAWDIAQANPTHPDAQRSPQPQSARALVKKICQHCGSDDVGIEATARWNVADQDWALSDVYDGQTFCSACDGETSLASKTLEGEEANVVRTFTVFVQQANGKGTTHISAHDAASEEEATAAALAETASDWDETVEELRVIGVAAGDVEILSWDDLEA